MCGAWVEEGNSCIHLLASPLSQSNALWEWELSHGIRYGHCVPAPDACGFTRCLWSGLKTLAAVKGDGPETTCLFLWHLSIKLSGNRFNLISLGKTFHQLFVGCVYICWKIHETPSFEARGWNVVCLVAPVKALTVVVWSPECTQLRSELLCDLQTTKDTGNGTYLL